MGQPTASKCIYNIFFYIYNIYLPKSKHPSSYTLRVIATVRAKSLKYTKVKNKRTKKGDMYNYDQLRVAAENISKN